MNEVEMFQEIHRIFDKYASQFQHPVAGTSCPHCDISPVRCKCCGEVLSDIKHPVADASQPAAGYSREQMLVCHLAGQEDAGCKHPSLSDAQAYVTLSLPASQPAGNDAISFHLWMKENDTHERAEEWFHYSDEDMYRVFKTLTHDHR